LYSDEASLSLTPTITHTYSPCGSTPVITISTEISRRLYMASAISPFGDLLYMVRNNPFDSQAIIEYLEYLMEQLNRKLLIIWDGASIHDSQQLRNWLDKLPQGKIILVQQPRYSPELNADEQVWSYLKNYKLKNQFNQNLKELQKKTVQALEDIKANPQLIIAFFEHPELGFMTI